MPPYGFFTLSQESPVVIPPFPTLLRRGVLRWEKSCKNPQGVSSHQQMPHLLDNDLFQHTDTLKAFVSSYAAEHGFPIAITHSNCRSITWKCRAVGTSPCPFTIRGTFSHRNGKWKLSTMNSEHTDHGTVTCARARARDAHIIHLCTEMKMKPRFILQRVRLDFPDQGTSILHVYSTLRNYRKRQKRI